MNYKSYKIEGILKNASNKAPQKFKELLNELKKFGEPVKIELPKKGLQKNGKYVLSATLNLLRQLKEYKKPENEQSKINMISLTRFKNKLETIKNADECDFDELELNEISELYFDGKSLDDICTILKLSPKPTQIKKIDKMFLGYYSGAFLRPESVGGGGFHIAKIYMVVEETKIRFSTTKWNGETDQYSSVPKIMLNPGLLSATFYTGEGLSDKFPFLFSLSFNREGPKLILQGDYLGIFPDMAEKFINVCGPIRFERVDDTSEYDVIESKLKLGNLTSTEDFDDYNKIKALKKKNPELIEFLKSKSNHGAATFLNCNCDLKKEGKEFLANDYRLSLLSHDSRVLRQLPLRINIFGNTYLRGFNYKIFEGVISIDNDNIVINTFKKYFLKGKTNLNELIIGNTSDENNISIYDTNAVFENPEGAFYNYIFTARWHDDDKEFINEIQYHYEGIRTGVELNADQPLSGCRIIITPESQTYFDTQLKPIEVDISNMEILSPEQIKIVNLLKERNNETEINNNVMLVRDSNKVYFDRSEILRARIKKNNGNK